MYRSRHMCKWQFRRKSHPDNENKTQNPYIKWTRITFRRQIDHSIDASAVDFDEDIGLQDIPFPDSDYIESLSQV